jgi:riboflavin kinase/FMN adenylyltransferase
VRKFFKSVVIHGSKDGSKNSYPTINLDPNILNNSFEKGVYASWVRVGGDTFPGALYLGPRLVKNESHDVLEIYILDFSAEIYGEEVEFSLEKNIRNVMDFTDFSKLKEQIKRDIENVKEVLDIK